MIAIAWHGDHLELLDQRCLPKQVEYIDCWESSQVADCIRNMVVRGAPAIGIAAAFGMALAAREKCDRSYLQKKAEELRNARPTAVNLSWAIDRMLSLADSECSSERITAEAEKMYQEDLKVNKAIGRYGAKVVPKNARVLTHCNAGALATTGYGTALGVIRWAVMEQKKHVEVYACETRPYLQGARLTAWELLQDGIPVTLLVDGAAAFLLCSGKVDIVVVGADRVSADGDVINKIGTYGIALAARAAGVPFYVAAPTSTIDVTTPTGCDVEIEERGPEEVTQWMGEEIAPAGVNVFNPAFDRTPAELVTALITEKGILKKPNRCAILNLIAKEN